ncbi:hypothetical protein D3C71_1040550 [compost metagenome]
MPIKAAAGANHRLPARSSTKLVSSVNGRASTPLSHARGRVNNRQHRATSSPVTALCHADGRGLITLSASSIEATLAWYSLPLIQRSRVVGVSRRGAMPLAVMPTSTRRPRSSAGSTSPLSTSA